MMLDGRKIAQFIIDDLKKKPIPKKELAAVMVGDSLASLSFLKQKEKVARKLNVRFKLFKLEEKLSQEDLEKKVAMLSANEDVGGIIIQLPLPKKFDRGRILNQLGPEKDVDNLTGKAPVRSPAVLVVKNILQETSFNLKGKIIAVVGSTGFLVGRPVVNWLNYESGVSGYEIKIKEADAETENIKDIVKDADLIISGVGKENLINPVWLKNGVGVIDFGYPSDLAQLPASNLRHLKFWTPTPGGTGPILVAELFRNFYKLAN